MSMSGIEEERSEHQLEEDVVMEVPEIDGDLLVELLEYASLAAAEEADEAAAVGRDKKQLGVLTADVGDGWDGQELNAIHPHQEGCEDCGLDDILSGLDGCGCPAPAPYAVDDSGEYYWMGEMEAAGPFTGECVGEWYMDGMVMEWEDGRSYYSYGGDAACTEQQYGIPLWE